MLKRKRVFHSAGPDYAEDHVANAIHQLATENWAIEECTISGDAFRTSALPIYAYKLGQHPEVIYPPAEFLKAESIIQQVYADHLLASGFAHRRAMLLEISRYLENHLWPAFHPKWSGKAHILSIAAIVNEKCRERVPAWQAFHAHPEREEVEDEKFSEGRPVWDSSSQQRWNPKFAAFFEKVLQLLLLPIDSGVENGKKRKVDKTDEEVALEKPTLTEKVVLLIFITHAFDCLAEENGLWDEIKRLVSLRLWYFLRPERQEEEFKRNTAYANRYRGLLRRDQQAGLPAPSEQLHASFLPKFVGQFLEMLHQVSTPGFTVEPLYVHYLERFVLFLVNVECMLPARRYFNTLLDDLHVLVHCQQSPLFLHMEPSAAADATDEATLRENVPLFRQLVSMLEFYVGFEIDDATGEMLSDKEVDRRHCEAVQRLQWYLYQQYMALDDLKAERELTPQEENQRRNLHAFCVANVGAVEDASGLRKYLEALEHEQLYAVAAHLALVPSFPQLNADEEDANQVKMDREKLLARYSKSFLLLLLIQRYRKRPSQLNFLNSLPLYPTEEVIWDENRVPVDYYSGEEVLALPKLHLQFLTLHDYLLRNFDLFRLESTYEIRQDLEDAIRRMKPWKSEVGETVFSGWSRMAVPVQNFSIIEVAPPHLGQSHPSRVRADITITLNMRREVAAEWDNLRRYDPCFLITVRPQVDHNYRHNRQSPFVPQVGLLYVRGCEIEGLLDAEGKVINEEERNSKGLSALKKSQQRTYRVRLDPCQYQEDVDRLKNTQETSGGMEDVYDTFNILLRRKPKENNFKAVLETIRELMNTQCVVPEWLHDLLLGYQDPSLAHYSQRADTYQTRQDWRDTFLSADHLLQSFPQYHVEFNDRRRKFGPAAAAETEDMYPPPPYRLIFPPMAQDSTLERVSANAAVHNSTAAKPCLQVEAYSPPLQPKVTRDLLLSERSKWGNRVAFTPTQVEAIRSGMQPGLTMVVGPPGTGKTDIAVQMVHNLYHNYPNQRTLIVTHSNQALNQLFEKIMLLDVDESHLLRLGHGGEALDTEKDFSRHGRVNYVLKRRLELLREVTRLSQLLGTLGQASVTDYQKQVYEWRKTLKAASQGVQIAEQSNTAQSDTDPSGNLATDSSSVPFFPPVVIPSEPTKAANPSEESMKTTAKSNDETNQSKKKKPATQTAEVLPYTCETSQHFFLHVVLARWEEFLLQVARIREMCLSHVQGDEEDAEKTVPRDAHLQYSQEAKERFRKAFPFLRFFCENKHGHVVVAPEELFPGISLAADLAIAQALFLQLERSFRQLEEFRAFELMRTATERSNYLLVQHAKIVAMTCTHAALRRKDLVQLGFTYDNILMEEAAQILEIETFIPLLLQNPELVAESGQTAEGTEARPQARRNRLKRWIMIGDHHQLPPIIKNMAFYNYCNMGQSLFARFVKLGVPTVQLDAQGRARPALAHLYSWRYRSLRDLPHVHAAVGLAQFGLANAGMRHEYQFVNVEDYQGQGESEPSPYFYQNRAEAEYVVALFQYMRLLGYPAERISILTTYNGQKQLLRDIINQKCYTNPLFGRPHKVTTVDKYQGQQNDYILLSLVRTRTVGHVRDVRRLVVALSRARLGLYIFGRVRLFAGCHELAPAMRILLHRPTALELVSEERWVDPREPPLGVELRKCNQSVEDSRVRTVADMSAMLRLVEHFYTSCLEHMNLYQQQQLEWQRKEAEEQRRREEERRRALEEVGLEPVATEVNDENEDTEGNQETEVADVEEENTKNEEEPQEEIAIADGDPAMEIAQANDGTDS